MLKLYCLCVLGASLVISCISMIMEDEVGKRFGQLVGMLLTTPVIYYIWVV